LHITATTITRIPGKHIDRGVREGNGERRKKDTQCMVYICPLPICTILHNPITYKHESLGFLKLFIVIVVPRVFLNPR